MLTQKEIDSYVNTRFTREVAGIEKITIEDLKQAYSDGFDEANDWHKPSKKLPEDGSLVLAYEFDNTEPSLYLYVASNCWEWLPRRIASLSNKQIRLWKEVVLAKE